MKTKIIPRFLSVIAFVCLCLYNPDLRSQTVIYENIYNTTEHSIIKNFKEDKDIKYDVWPNRRFELIDRSSDRLYTVNMNFVFVIDFEIYNGYVYFCGSGCVSQAKEDNCGAVFGYFNIDSVFFHNGYIHYCVFYGLNASSNPIWGNEKLDYFSSLDVAIDRNSMLHLAMTGQLSNVNGTESASLVADALRKSDGTWVLHYTADYTQTLTFCDVAGTQNNVIVTGIKNIDTEVDELFYVPYKKPEGIDSSFFNLQANFLGGISIGIQEYCTSHSIIYPHEYPKIRAMQGEYFAIACHDTSINVGFYVVSVYDTPYANPIYRFRFGRSRDNPFGWAYNKMMKILCLVGRGAQRYIYTMHAPYSTCERVSTQIATAWLDVDEIHDTEQFVFSGSRTFHEENIWVYDLTATGSDCIREESEFTIPLDKRQHVVNLEQIVRRLDVTMFDEPVKASSVPIEVICR